ncbi:MAG: hypothetical protein JEZ06_15110 [Anaerolineaceae bacterium]|nr:hypothetical protein [Anaerolineaceae bacterium]
MDWSLVPVWIANGFLVILYMLAENIIVLLLIPTLAWIYVRQKAVTGTVYAPSMRIATIAAGSIALLAGIFAPMPAPVLLLIMTLVSGIAMHLESFRPDETLWGFIQGAILYSLIGIGLSIFQWWVKHQPMDPDSIFTMGRQYIGIISAVAIWGVPIGFIGNIIKNLLIHPPTPGGSPERLVEGIRTRYRR